MRSEQCRELVDGQRRLTKNRTERAYRHLPMHRHDHDTTVLVLELHVTAALADCSKPARFRLSTTFAPETTGSAGLTR
jgi:hypothetical protein